MGISLAKIGVLLFVRFIAFAFLITSGLLFLTYLRVRTLPTSDVPEQFAIYFHAETKKTVHLAQRCQTFAFSCLGKEQQLRSPFFPYRELEITEVAPESCKNFFDEEKDITSCTEEFRSVLTDSFWHVFLISITKRGQSTKFFGPFRKVPLPSI